jgi:hypothetical protein
MFSAQTFCEKRKTCWPDGINDYRFQQSWGTLQTCIDDQWRSCVADLGRPNSGNSAMRVNSCAQALSHQSCLDFQAGITLPTSDCPSIVGGHADNGTDCSVSNECKSNYCNRTEAQRCGKCADKGGLNATCEQNSDCANMLTCQGMACAPAMPAVAKAKAGDPCGTGLPACDTDLTCVGTGTMKTCMAQVMTAGAPCDSTKKTLPDCNNDKVHLWCNPNTMMCEARKWNPIGMTCNELPDGSFAGCSGGANCVRAVDALGKRTTTGICIADATEGLPCYRNTADGPGCAVPLRCIYDVVNAPNGVCLAADTSMCSLPVPMRDGGSSAPADSGVVTAADAGASD